MKSLFVVPHMDDEAISCGALIRARVLAGDEVMVLAVYGRTYNYGSHDVDADNEEEMYDFYRAANILGYRHALGLLLKEGEPTQVGYYEVLKYVELHMQKFQPDEVIGPAADDLNQDHRFLAHVLDIALRPANLGNVRRRLEFFGVDGTFKQPNWYFAFSDVKFMQAKLLAVATYRRETRAHPHPRSSVNLMAQAMVFGAACGYHYAEPYRLRFERQTCASP